MKTKNKLNLLWIRISIAYKILFKPKTHWFFLSMTTEQLTKMLGGDGLEAELMTHRMLKYNVDCVVDIIHSQKDDVDRILDKARFEAEATLYKKN